jgi:hypothetical protein
MLLYDALRAEFFSEFVSGCRKIFSSVNRGRLCDVSRELISVFFASDCPLSQAFHLYILILPASLGALVLSSADA